MTQNDFLRRIEEILEVNAGSVQLDQKISELENWDSLAVMTFIAMADDEAGITLQGKAISEARTVRDLMELFGDKIIA